MEYALRTAVAERDLEEIGYQIAFKDNRPETARKILCELADTCNKLAKFAPLSLLGTEAPEIGEGVRLFTHKRWVIIFVTSTKEPSFCELLMLAKITLPGKSNCHAFCMKALAR